MKRTLIIDKVECTGCEYCVDALPFVFKMNDENVSIAYDSQGAKEEEIKEVIDHCPAECIRWEECQ